MRFAICRFLLLLGIVRRASAGFGWLLMCECVLARTHCGHTAGNFPSLFGAPAFISARNWCQCTTGLLPHCAMKAKCVHDLCNECAKGRETVWNYISKFVCSKLFYLCYSQQHDAFLNFIRHIMAKLTRHFRYISIICF